VAVLLGPESYNRLLEHLEDLHLVIDTVESRTGTELILDLDEYFASGGA
jgi:hypothetical protein